MKTEMTVQQAITMYSVIEALSNQFDVDNIRAGRPLRASKQQTPPPAPLTESAPIPPPPAGAGY